MERVCDKCKNQAANVKGCPHESCYEAMSYGKPPTHFVAIETERLCNTCADGPPINCPDRECYTDGSLPHWKSIEEKSKGPIAQAIAKGGCEIDRWEHRSVNMKCGTCMSFLKMRCRRHAPTLQGWPAVFPTDWCGDHKLSKSQMGGE